MKVFISHTSDDHEFVLALAEKLKNDGMDVWIDDWELNVGDSIVKRISEGLQKSSFLIVVFSKYSIKSEWVLRELNSTLMRQLGRDHIVILPVLLEIDFEEIPLLFRDIFAVKFERTFISDSQYQKIVQPIRKKAKTDEIAKYQDKYFENIEHIDLILGKKEPSRHEVKFILDLIRDEHYRNYFLRQVRALHWFDILKAENYFKAQKAPSAKSADQEGYFTIPEWNVLPYLERVSEEVNLSGNEKYIYELLQIITGVSICKDKKDNYRTWWYFVKILVNIPNERIPAHVIELVPIWLDSQFNVSLPGSEVSRKLLPKFLTDNPEDIKKAEMVIDYMTAIKRVKLPEERAKLYKKDTEFRLIVDWHWVKETFEKHAKEIGQKCSRKVIDDLSAKIHLLLKKDESVIPLEVDNKIYRIVLLEDEHQYILKIFDAGEKSKEEVFEEAFLEQPHEGELIKETILSKGDLCSFVNRTFDELKDMVQLKSLKDLRRKFTNVYRNLYDHDTYRSLYDESRSPLDDPLDVLTYSLKTVLLNKARKDREKTHEIIDEFFDDPYLYFKKMALYIVGNNIEDYAASFWQAFEKDTENILLEGLYFGDELKHVLEGLKEFTDYQKKLLISRIEAGPGYVSDEDSGLYISRWKQERYGALIKDPESLLHKFNKGSLKIFVQQIICY